jgi:hypothetical protein
VTIRWWVTRIAVVGSLLVPLGYLAATPSDAVPAVRVVHVNARYQVSYRRAHFEVSDISAVGPKIAWAFGYRVNAAGHLTTGLVMRYNGRAWTTVPYPGQRTFQPASLTALSPGNVWLLGYQSHTGPYTALHYIHGRWRSFPLPANAQGSLVLSDTDIWVAGSSQIPGCNATQFGPGCSVAGHWNGVRWHYYRVAVSNLSSLAGSSGSDIWAAGWDAIQTKSPYYVQTFVFRWTGSKFRRAHLSTTPTDYIPSVTVDSPRSVWLAGPNPMHREQETGTCITHWNGRQWSAFLSGYLSCFLIVSDRHGGAWFGGDEHWTGSELILYAPLKGPGGSLISYGVAPVPRSRYQWIYGAIPLGRRHGAYQVTGFIDKRG